MLAVRKLFSQLCVRRAFYHSPYEIEAALEEYGKKLFPKGEKDKESRRASTRFVPDFSSDEENSIPLDRRAKKQINLTETDNKKNEYMKEFRKLKSSVNQLLGPEGLNNRGNTAKLERALRLNGGLDIDRELGENRPFTEYHNYDKFKANYASFLSNIAEDPDDPGTPMNTKRTAEYITMLDPSGESVSSDYADIVKDEVEGNPIDEELYENEIQPDDEEAEEIARVLTTEDGHMRTSGRLSPQAKEEIYRLYLQGWTVKDLSEKYGILTQRVKAVLWLRRYFHEEVMPFTDRSAWRKAIEIDFLEAEDTPFADYGLDLDMMAMDSRGVERSFFTTQHYDVCLEEAAAPLDDIKGKLKYYFVERAVIGKGAKAYKVKDVVVHRGTGRHTVSQMFKQICYNGNKAPHKLPKKVQSKIKYGPRIASLGFRMGGHNRRG